MKIQFVILIATIFLMGCNAQSTKEQQAASGQKPIDPKDFPAYDFGAGEGYHGKIHAEGSTQEQLEVQAAALDFWFETSALLLNEGRFIDIYATQGASAYMDSLPAYFAGLAPDESGQSPYRWFALYTPRAKAEILAEKPCEASTTKKCMESYHDLSEEDQRICDELRKEIDACRDIWFHCPGATFFEAGKPKVEGKRATMPLQLYQATRDDNFEVTRLDKCRLINLHFVLVGKQWMFDHREILN